MKRIITPLLAAASIFAGIGSGHVFARDIPVVGLNKTGEAEMRKVPMGLYLGELRKTLGGTDQAVLTALSSDPQIEETQCTSVPTKSQSWMLRSVTIGVSMTVTASFGTIFRVSGRPRFRLVYANTLDPSFPD